MTVSQNVIKGVYELPFTNDTDLKFELETGGSLFITKNDGVRYEITSSSNKITTGRMAIVIYSTDTYNLAPTLMSFDISDFMVDGVYLNTSIPYETPTISDLLARIELLETSNMDAMQNNDISSLQNRIFQLENP